MFSGQSGLQNLETAMNIVHMKVNAEIVGCGTCLLMRVHL